MKLIAIISIAILFNQIELGNLIKVRYDDYKVYSVKINTREQYEAISYGLDYSIWKDGGINRPSDVMVPPHKIADFHELASTHNLEKTLRIDNVQRLVTLFKSYNLFFI